ncbi:hypothetical protein MBLNU459_g1368t1 [Dothideomycetes sp. NU459]
MGRPKKRRSASHGEDLEEQHTELEPSLSQNHPLFSPSPLDQNGSLNQAVSLKDPGFVTGALSQHWNTNQQHGVDSTLQTESSVLDSTLGPEAVTVDPVSTPQTCACLASMYLTLDNLRGMHDFAFPFGLHLLREALGTAWSSVQCQACPTSCITAIQNSHMLGVLLVSIAERYWKIIGAIETEEKRASETNQTLSIRVGDMSSANSHLHTGQATSCPGSIVLELKPAEWRTLAKKVVKAEIHDATDKSRPGFMSVVRGLEDRQKKWHEGAPPHDMPVAMRAQRVQTANKTPLCLMMVEQARNVVNTIEYD